MPPDSAAAAAAAVVKVVVVLVVSPLFARSALERKGKTLGSWTAFNEELNGFPSGYASPFESGALRSLRLCCT